MWDKMNDFSNRDRNVFLIKLDSMIDRGALMSRYSRTSSLDIRSVYDREFSSNSDRGSDFYRRIFLEYGDESVAELVTAQAGIQNVSNVASKVIEEIRIGISFLEKSSRYVRYDRKVDGHYLYAPPDSIGIPGALRAPYVEYCDSLFDFYSKSLPVVTGMVERVYPLDAQVFDIAGTEVPYADLGTGESDIAEKAYRNALRARALDDIRYVLPASTLTNIGMSGNGRSYINLLQKLETSGLPECRNIGNDLYRELEAELPELVKSARNAHGKEMEDFLKSRNDLPDHLEVNHDLPAVRLVGHEPEDVAMGRIEVLMEYPHTSGSLESSRKINQGNIFGSLVDARKNRRHKPGRAFETVNYLFELNPSFASFREIQRHRMQTIIRKPLTPLFGYFEPEIIARDPDLIQNFRTLMEEGLELWNDLRRASGIVVSQYVIPFAYRYPFAAYMSLSEATYFCELRSTPAAHYELRDISWKMADEIARVHPHLSGLMKFIDRSASGLGRIRAEARKEMKLKDTDRGKKADQS